MKTILVDADGERGCRTQGVGYRVNSKFKIAINANIYRRYHYDEKKRDLINLKKFLDTNL
jgi:hypothetical protein